MALPGLPSFSAHAAAAAAVSTTSSSDDPSKKVRKPYTISKSRESWTEPEHDKFLEALQLFDRDWKKIEAFVGSKTVIQIRSHAQKYFIKVQKSGIPEHLPPPRPKRKAAHPYPQKASKNGSFQVSMSDPLEPGLRRGAGADAASASWAENSHSAKGQLLAVTCSSMTADSTPTMRTEQGNHGSSSSSVRVLPDFARVYSFIGSVFDPDASDHLRKLTTMDPIDVETVLLLMRNLSINLTSPSFEEHRRLLSAYEIESDEKGDFSAYLVQESPQLLT